MGRSRGLVVAAGVGLLALVTSRAAWAGEQPVAIFHAFDQPYADVEGFVCELGAQGYSHVQIAPAQKSNPSDKWWARYQPVDYAVIEGKGSETELKRLVKKAHDCGVKVIADVVFNHMADLPSGLNFPGIGPQSFHSPRCDINYHDGNRDSEVTCWLGSLPDLDQSKAVVMNAHKKHLKKLLSLGIDGIRFDAAKHMPVATVQAYIDYVDQQSHGKTWNYLEVIEDDDTHADVYTPVAAVEDFLLYRAMKGAFSFGGDLRALRVPVAIPDARSVTFGRNHDNIKELNPDSAIDPYADRTDSYLATAFVLAHEGGTPLVLGWDNADVPFIRTGVKFRQIMRQRAAAGSNVKETVLGVVDSPTLLVMERGPEGFFVVNKATARFDVPALDLTLTNLEGCYRELRSNFLVAVEKRAEKKFVTRWGTWSRGGMQVQGRDALFFVREPWSECQGH